MWDTNIRLKRRGFNDTMTCTTHIEELEPRPNPSQMRKNAADGCDPLHRWRTLSSRMIPEKIVSTTLFGLWKIKATWILE